MKDCLVVIGAGGHAKVLIESIRAAWPGRRLVVLDDDPAAAKGSILGLPISGRRDWLEANAPNAEVVPAVGSNVLRRELLEWLLAQGRTVASIVDPSARLSPSARLGAGTFLAPGAIVNAQTTIGDAAIINTGATVDHDCRIGTASHIAPGCHLCGNVEVADGALVGIGAVVIPGMRIGRGAVVGAGAAVTEDVPDGARVGGVPARPLR